jgi:hypothetical protein
MITLLMHIPLTSFTLFPAMKHNIDPFVNQTIAKQRNEVDRDRFCSVKPVMIA